MILRKSKTTINKKLEATIYNHEAMKIKDDQNMDCWGQAGQNSKEQARKPPSRIFNLKKID